MADLVIAAADVIAQAGSKKREGTAGATIAAGQLLYKDTADANKLKLAQNDGTAAEAEVAGIALHGALNGQPIDYVEEGPVAIGTGIPEEGKLYVASATPGGVAPVDDIAISSRVTVVGYGNATDDVLEIRRIVTGRQAASAVA